MSRTSNDFRRSSTSRPRRSSQKLARGRPATGMLNWRACRHEELENRRLLTVVPFVSIGNQVYGDLQAVETFLVSALNNYSTGSTGSLPFVGKHLGDVSKAISGFSSQIQTALVALNAPNDPSPTVVQSALFNALGPGGLNILGDRNGNGVDASDVLITSAGPVLNDDFAVQLKLQGTVATPAVPLKFDTGLPGLPLSIRSDGSLATTVSFTYELAFTYDAQTQNVDLDNTKKLAGADHQLALAVGIGLQDFSATAIMGFVQGDLTANAGQPNGLSLAVQVDNLGQGAQINITGSADANLRLSGSFAGTENDFPGIDTDLHLHWSLDTENPSAAAPDVWFDNVYLDLGDFISNVVGPVFQNIHYFTQPLAPVLEVLGYPLSGLTDLSRLVGGGDVTLLDLGGVAATVTGFGPLYDLVEKVLEVIDAINQFDVGDSVRLKLGGFDLDSFDLRNVAAAGNPLNTAVRNLTDLSPSNLIGIAQSLAAKIDELPITNEEKEFLKGFAEQLNNGFSVTFPILEDPMSVVFPMLLGRDGDLFTLDAEVHQSAQGSVATGFSIFGIGIDFGGEVEIDTKFTFAYDTFGLRNLISDIAAGNTSAATIAEDIVDGFYLASDSFFELAGTIYAAAGAGIGIFNARVGGFVSTGDSGDEPVSVTIVDPNNDGKLRFSEFSMDSFEMGGELAAELGVEVRVGFEVLGEFVGLKKRFDMARELLIDFNLDPNDPTDPSDAVLASLPDANGNINLYIGALAHLREEVDNEDGDEQLRIQHVETTPAGETIDITIRQTNFFGRPFDVTQRIGGVKKITGIDGIGNLIIDVLPGVTSDVHFEGGTGRAELMYEGTGIAYLKAGIVDSSLTGGQGNNTLVGRDGNDTISLGHAGNTVMGGAGNNTIIVNAPTTQGGNVVGGDSTNNMLVVSAGEYTSSIDLVIDSPGYLRLAYDDTQGTYPNLILSHFNRVSVTAQDRNTEVHVGDLSPAGIETVYINVPTLGQGGRKIELGTRYLLGTSDISLQPFDHEYATPDGGVVIERAMLLSNLTTGVETYILGVAAEDVTTIVQHGGTATLGALGSDNGTIVFDTRQRSAGADEAIFMHLPSDADGNQIEMGDSGANDFKIEAQLYPTVIFKGLATIDRIEVDVDAPTDEDFANSVGIDASALQGLLDVDLLGTGVPWIVTNAVIISELAGGGVIDIHGGATTTTLRYGTGKLFDIAGDVRAHNVELTVDNSEALIPSLIVFGAAAALRRTSPDDGLRPGFIYDGLRGIFTVHAGPGDRIGLEQTAPGIDEMHLTNPSSTLDPLYVKAASADLLIGGNWSLYFGREMLADGGVVRTGELGPIGIQVDATFTGNSPREVVFDAIHDPTGAQHDIGGRGIVEYARYENSMPGLRFLAAGTTLADDLLLYITGAVANIGLPEMAGIEITVDSNDRFAGINPTAPNDVTVRAVIGTVNMFPIGQYDSRIEGGNPVNILATLPVDTTSVEIDSSASMGVIEDNPGTVFGFGGDFFFADAYYFAPVPEGFWQLVDEVTFGDSVTKLGAWAFANYPQLTTGAPLPYSIHSPLFTSAGLAFHQTWLDPTSNYNPPLPTSATATALLYPKSTFERVNSTLNLNASQVRGQFNVNVLEPNYATANHFASFFASLTQYSYQLVEGGVGYSYADTPFARYGVTFGRTDVNLTHVGPQTSAHVRGSAPRTNFVGLSSLETANHYNVLTQADTHVNVGVGTLANIEGSVSFDQVYLTIDGRNGTTPNILTLNGDTFSGWTGSGPTSGFGVIYGTLNIIGGAADSFSILQTPTNVAKVSIQNVLPLPEAMSMAIVADAEPVAASLAEAANTPGVYLVAKRLNQILEINGNFEFYIGRKLNTDGSTEIAADITGFTNFVSNSSDQQTILYNFTGDGQGRVVYDVTTAVTFGPTVMVRADAAYPGKGVLAIDFGSTLIRNKLVYSPNTDLTILAPQRQIALVDNFVEATIRFVLNPLNSTNFFDEVRVGAAYGPVFVTGRGDTSFVTLQPPQFSGGRLDDTIRAAVTVTDAGLRIIADEAGTPVGGPLLDVVLSANSLTGLTPGPIYFERLTDFTPNFNVSQPGLHIGLPKQGAASLTIVDTPAGVRTAINTFAAAGAGQVAIQATTGPLLLGSMDIFGHAYSRNGFGADSVAFGDQGSLQGIRGKVTTSSGSSRYIVPGGTVLDNHLDASREVLMGEISWTGLAPAAFEIGSTQGSEFTVLSSDESSYRIEIVRNKVHLMAGVGTTVEIVKPQLSSAIMPYGMTVYGAEQVRVNPGESNPATSTDGTFTVLAHPDRPSDATELIVDFGSVAYPVFLDDAGDSIGEFWGGNIPFKRSYVKFQGNTTHFTFLAFNRADGEPNPFGGPIQVVDTVALSTTINPGNRLLTVTGTTSPLIIEHDGPQPVTLGDAGNMQNLHGVITVNVDDASTANVVVDLNSSGDSTPRNIGLGHPSANEWLITGLAPVAIAINGALARPSIRGGVGANSLTGPSDPSAWDITSAGVGLVQGVVSFSGISSLIGGSANDDFYFRGVGQLAGSLHGGDGFDTVHYMGILDGSETIDLESGTLPRVGGQVISIEAVDVVLPLAVENPGNQIGRVGLAITPLQIVATGGDPNKTYSATGLPTGLSVHPTTGLITGTISSSIAVGTNFNVNVTVNDGSTTKTASFTWSVQDVYAVVNPGNQLTPEGVPISLQILVDNPTNIPLRFAANGLPSYLSIDPYSGVITGSIYFYTQQYGPNVQFNANVFVYDDAAGKVKTVSFTWRLLPGFQLWSGAFYDYASETIDFPVVTNPYNHTITVSAIGLPPGLSLDTSGRITGTIDDFAFRQEPYLVQMTAYDDNIDYTATQTLQWYVSPAMLLSPHSPAVSYAGTSAQYDISFQNALDHQFTLVVANLPPGLSADEFGAVSGTVDVGAATGSPYLVTITLTDTTIGHTMQDTFEWTVLPPILIDDLNANTPPGTPVLVDVFDPIAGNQPQQMAAVHYPSQTEGAESLYVFVDKLYVIENGQRTAVPSVDPQYPEIGWVYGMLPVPGRGLLFTDGNNQLWFADQAGARVIHEEPIYLNLDAPIALYDSLFFGSYDSFTFHPQITQIDFSGSVPQISQIDTGEVDGIEGIRQFAGGIVYNGYLPGSSYRLMYWYNAATGQTTTIGTSAVAFADMTTVPAADGTQNLFAMARPDWDLQWRLVAINSGALYASSPDFTFLEEFEFGTDIGSINWPVQPFHVSGNKVSFSTRTYDGETGEYSYQFWTSDGTGPGTVGAGTPLTANAHITQQITFAGDVFFIYQLNPLDIDEATVVAQLWKFDPTTGAFWVLHDFVGPLNADRLPSGLIATDESLYFRASNGLPNQYGLWRLDAIDAAPSLVPSKPGNAYANPDPQAGVAVGDRFYFFADSVALPDQWGYFSRQLWSVGPPVVVEAPGDFTADGLVGATDIDAIWELIQANNPLADLNGDGLVNIADADHLIRVILNTEYGDANLDGFVDAADLAVTRQKIGSLYGTPNWAGGDFDGDGVVDATDLATVRRNLGFARPAAAPLIAEPAAALSTSVQAPTADIVATALGQVANEKMDHGFEDLLTLLAGGNSRRKLRLSDLVYRNSRRV